MKRSILETTIGQHNTKLITSLERDLVKYTLTEESDITYGHSNINGGYIVFITGRNDMEKGIQPFTFPILTKDVNDTEVVFIDIRSAVKIKDGQEDINLDDIIRDKGLFRIIKTQAIYTLLFKHSGDMGPMFKGGVKSMAGWISSTVGHNLMLNVSETRDLNVIVLDSIMSIIDPDKDADVRSYLASNLLLSSRISESETEDILKETNRNVSSIKELVENIKSSGISDKLDRLTLESFTTIMKSTVFGLGLVDRVMLSMEHLPTWIALSYEVIENRLYQKTQLAGYFKRNGKSLDSKDFVKFVDAELSSVSKNLSREDSDDDYNDMLPKGTSLFNTTNHSIYIVEKGDSRLYRFYLGDIGDSNQDTAEIMEAFKDVKRGKDELEIVINCNGGIVNQGMQLLQSIEEAFGDKVTTLLNNTGKSMGAMLFCIGNTRIVNKYSDLMFHNYSTFAMGKGDDVATSVNHSEESIGKFFKDLTVEKGFFKEEEYARLKDGHDYWMMADEILERGLATHIKLDNKLYTREEYNKLNKGKK